MTKKAAENNIPDFAKKKAYIERLRPIDDVMFEILAKDPEVCEEILKVILENPKLKVLSVTPQDSIKNLYGRSVRLDALCELSTGETVNVEVQRSDNDNHLMRARYNLSCITANIMEPGAKFEKVPTVCFVYISEFDVFGENKTTYHVDSVIRETGTVVDDKCSRIFVNTKIKDETEISKLMEHFIQNNFSDPDFPKLSEAFYHYKHTDGGVNTMCAILDEYTKDIVEETKKKTQEVTQKTTQKTTVAQLFKDLPALSVDDVKGSFTYLSEDEIKKVYDEVHGNMEK